MGPYAKAICIVLLALIAICVCFYLLSRDADSAPKPLGTVVLLASSPTQATIQMHLERHPQQPNLVVRCGAWFTEQLLGRGVMDATVTVDLPEGATWCQAWALDEGSANGKDPTFITNVINWTVQ